MWPIYPKLLGACYQPLDLPLNRNIGINDIGHKEAAIVRFTLNSSIRIIDYWCFYKSEALRHLF